MLKKEGRCSLSDRIHQRYIKLFIKPLVWNAETLINSRKTHWKFLKIYMIWYYVSNKRQNIWNGWSEDQLRSSQITLLWIWKLRRWFSSYIWEKQLRNKYCKYPTRSACCLAGSCQNYRDGRKITTLLGTQTEKVHSQGQWTSMLILAVVPVLEETPDIINILDSKLIVIVKGKKPRFFMCELNGHIRYKRNPTKEKEE